MSGVVSRVAMGVSLAAVAATLTCSALESGPREAARSGVGGKTPVIFVSGVTGTKLEDPRTGALVWGGVRQLIRPRDGGYDLALPVSAPDESGTPSEDSPQARYTATGPLWKLRFPGWTKEIYRPLRERFESAGYRLGQLSDPRSGGDLFFFDYDWRYGNLDSIRRLDELLTGLVAARGVPEVDLICQSNAAKICRWLAKYGGLGLIRAEVGETPRSAYRIRRLALAGVSNGGSMRVLQLMNQGRSYIPLIGRRLQPELFFTVRPLFEDLPAGRDDLFFDENGVALDIDLFDAASWLEYGWSIFGQEAAGRLARAPRPDLFGDFRDRIEYLERQLDRARRFQALLAADAPSFGGVEYFLLENDSAPTMDRALVTRVRDRWRTFFLGNRVVDGNPKLRRRASAPGDGHATLDSQRALSPQEAAALVESFKVDGGHFEALIQPEALDAIVSFLTRGES